MDVPPEKFEACAAQSLQVTPTIHPTIPVKMSIHITPEMEKHLKAAVQKLVGARKYFIPCFYLKDAYENDYGDVNTGYDEKGNTIVIERSGRKHANLDEWYVVRGLGLLTPRDKLLPPLSSQLCYGDKLTRLDYKGIEMVLASAPASPTPLQAACAAFGAARTQVTELRKELQALQMQGTSVDNLTALIAKAEALKAALESMKPLSIRFVELCVSEGHLHDLDEMYIVEELAEVLEGKLKRE